MARDIPDFDDLMAFYQRDPQGFEQFRRQALRDAVERAPCVHRPALDGLLDRIEVARASATSPLDAAIIASRMMRESTERLLDAWEDVQEEIAGLHAAVVIERLRGLPGI
ncbi:DUF3135 domain-containing protein [Noviherbaspirillum sp. UKPF54]|uniref:DUF3135 domain-containing protein n=1 Tax=Noviherbaspirillum sp. UKPF54 TaxID=2601898 RepID=UPI0011B19268|nr:DUF3135 domain-containing protein [Noviherbaspirillum sp. UKPF54]QDZ29747.1 DUF3135 domain-containing protein [Noviherbaspirillum sp. UKPF54]